MVEGSWSVIWPIVGGNPEPLGSIVLVDPLRPRANMMEVVGEGLVEQRICANPEMA